MNPDEKFTGTTATFESTDPKQRLEILANIDERIDDTLRSIQKLAKCVAFEANRNTRMLTHSRKSQFALFYPYEDWLTQTRSELIAEITRLIDVYSKFMQERIEPDRSDPKTPSIGTAQLLFVSLLIAAQDFGVEGELLELHHLVKQEQIFILKEALDRGFMSGLPAVYYKDYSFGIDLLFEIAKLKGINIDLLTRTDDEWNDLVRLLEIEEFQDFSFLDTEKLNAENYDALGLEKSRVLAEWARYTSSDQE